jgi:ABC-type transporter Mla subunit MlaD
MTAMLGQTAAAKLSSQRKGAEAVMRKLQALAEAADVKRRPLLQTVHSCNEELQPLEARRAALLEELAQVTAVKYAIKTTQRVHASCSLLLL